MKNATTHDARPALGRTVLPDHRRTYRYLDPSAALIFRTPLQEHAAAADTKATATLIALAIMFPALAKLGGTLSRLLATQDAIGVVTLALLIGFAVLSVGALVEAFRVLLPGFQSAVPSLVFFRDIARLGREEYIARVQSLSNQQALSQMYYYNHNLSIVCALKFRQLRRAIRYFTVAFACWLGLFVLLIFNLGVYAR